MLKEAYDWNSIRLGVLEAWEKTAETVRVRYAIADKFEEERTNPMLAADAVEFARDLVERGGVLTGVERVRD